jgi:hypothetical protein
MRATGDTGREVELWRSGAFDRLPAGVEVPIIDAAPVDGGGWQLIMRDAGADLLGEGQRLDRRGIRRLFGAAQAIHRAFEGRPPSGLCTLGDRLRLFSRSTAERERGANNLGPKVHLRLWEVFADVAPPDIADVVLGLHADPSALCDELLACGRTLLHGDLKPGNIGLPPGRVVLIDWQLACEGPPAIDFIWPLAFEESFDATLDELLEDIRRVAGPDHDERALQLSIIFHMAMAAAEEAVHVVDDPDEAKRARAAAVLSWWVDKTRHALETTWAP